MTSFRSILCPSLQTFRSRIQPGFRVMGIDLTPEHIMFAVSDEKLMTAYPFGFIAKGASPAKDAQIFADAMAEAVNHRPEHPLMYKQAIEAQKSYDTSTYDFKISGAVLGVRLTSGNTKPDQSKEQLAYLEEFFGSSHITPLSALILYNEAYILDQVIRSAQDVHSNTQLIGADFERFERLEPRLFEAQPKSLKRVRNMDHEVLARISATEILQVFLDDLKKAKI